jgi:hypothetical protein
MNVFLSYILNFIPVPIGILAFYVIRSIRISSKKIRICDDENNRRTYLSNAIENQMPIDCSSLRKFEIFVKDMLIVSGVSVRRGRPNYPSIGFSKIGVINIQNLESMPEYLMRMRKERIILFVHRPESLLVELLAFGKTSGILISYSLDYKLEFLQEIA